MTGAAYAALKGVHMTCAALSHTLFFLRGWSRFQDGRLHMVRWARIAPHVIDTLLLTAAVAMALQVFAVPTMRHFVLVKLAGAIVCILLGMAAFRWLRSQEARREAWWAALAVFVSLAAFAIGKSV